MHLGTSATTLRNRVPKPPANIIASIIVQNIFPLPIDK